MPAEATPEGGDRRQRPPAWILCSVYIIAVALLGAASVLALDLLWKFLASSNTVDRDSFVIQLLTMFLSMAAVTGVLALVFLPFRGVLKLRLLRATDERMNGFKAAGLTILAYFGFLAAYVVIARQVGIEKGDLDPDFLGSLMAYVFFAKWPLSSLLNPNGPASEPPASAQNSESPEPT